MSYKERKFGEWALVTGASSGIGAEFAEQLAAKGYHVIIAARRKEKLIALSDSLTERYGVSVKVVEVDLTEDNFLPKIKQVVEKLNVGILISNAGAANMGAFIRLPLEKLENMVRLNVNAQLQLTHFFSNYFVAQKKEGGILMVSTTAALQGVPYSANYSAAKAYILNLGEALHYELKSNGIHVTVLVPGPTEAPGLADRTDADLSKMPIKPQKVNALVREGMRGLWKNKPVVIGGGMSKIMAGMGKRFLSRKASVALWGKLMKPMVAVK